MNAQSQAIAGYTSQSAPTRTNRGTEYEIFAKVTNNMRIAATMGPQGFPALADAIHKNRKLWTLLATDVASNGNTLSQDLRARIFYLAEFTQDYSPKVLKSGASIAPLIEINAAIMRGLASGAAK
ncbi:flagellar biosynthesis regulator FlaF [uncultured Lentibacter sp.]|uniref:flagellar biosynthesis regulator FlaF n=1 Tax=uncultured Lentibacter sp. TaxID=1659309 RepID=UPI0026082E14|nr:flagellar biosynthesis regulator FlaF [uncultured Lentibacter sp.]MCW1954572.1 flagellar biosynthesis regulator FlaF [Roseobacter sp.]